MSKNTYYASSIGVILRDCKGLLNQIPESNLIYATRSANKAAHFLAQAACSMSDLGDYARNPPISISNVLALDSIE